MSPAPRQMSRRRFLTGLGVGAGVGAIALGACSAQGLATVPVPTSTRDMSRTQRVVRFGNWGQYVDVTPTGRYPTFEEFTRQTGVKVIYSVPIRDNFQFLGQIGIALAMGEDTGYDLVVLSDWLIPQLIEQGWVEELSPGLLTNAWRLLPQFRNWPVPDVRRYSLPWAGGFTGIGYNLRATRRPVTSMTDLLTSPDLRGRVSLNTGMSDVMGLVLLDMGSDPADFTAAEFNAALNRLRRSVQAGQIRAVSNYYLAGLVKGTIAAGVAWAGDILFGQSENPDLGFTWPQGGGMLWTDNMVIPALARSRANAERLMNFYYQPEVAAQLAGYVRYTCPVLGAGAAMKQIDPALAGERYIFPTPQLLRSGHYFKILTAAQSRQYNTAYQNTVGL